MSMTEQTCRLEDAVRIIQNADSRVSSRTAGDLANGVMAGIWAVARYQEGVMDSSDGSAPMRTDLDVPSREVLLQQNDPGIHAGRSTDEGDRSGASTPMPEDGRVDASSEWRAVSPITAAEPTRTGAPEEEIREVERLVGPRPTEKSGKWVGA
jgi:hypothetical protein